VGAAVTLVAVALGLPVLRDQARGLRSTTGVTDAALGAMELVAPAAPAAYQPDPQNAPQITAGRYLAAIRDIGSDPSDTPAELAVASSAERATADRVLQELVARLTPASVPGAGAAPALEQAGRARVTPSAGCAVARPAGGDPVLVTAAVPERGLVVRALGGKAVEVKLRRFGDGFGNGPVGTVAPGQPQRLRLPADASSQPYHVQLSALGGVAACAA
jgi:hypothetical protein